MPLTGPPLVAVATGIIGSAWLSGAISTFSIAGAPAARAVPQTTVHVWQHLYNYGAASMPKFSIAFALSYFYAAYATSGIEGLSWTSYLAAGGCVVATIPFTLTAMASTNGALHKAAKSDSVSAAEVATLVDRWILLNYARSMLPLLGTAVGVWAFVTDAL